VKGSLKLWALVSIFSEWFTEIQAMKFWACQLGTSQLVTWSTRHTENSCDELTILFYAIVMS